ncbi:MAG: pimeloyl-ACP methyl ester carboxylesterase [Gammaproteobacteria bacterium]|jgi:pimeloyl-ACP methyl ester carboxylesterase
MILDPQRGADESPADYEARVHALSTLYRTPMSEGTMAWHQWGSADKPPLMLLHGGFGSWRHWILNVVPLSQHFQVFCADLPGLGESDRMADEYTADNIAAQVLNGIDHLLGAANTFRLAGFSFGGIIGSHVAALAGERVQQFAAIAPGALGLPMNFPELASLGGQRGADNVKRIHRENLGRLMIRDEARIDDLALHLQLETVRRARARSGAIPRSDAAAKALARCVCPIAGVWGELDVIAQGYMPTRVKLFRDIQPDCPFEIIEGAGHWVMYERPDLCNEVLLKLLK